MIQADKINNLWVQQLFENDVFKLKLKQFVGRQQDQKRGNIDDKVWKEINSVSQQISGIIFDEILKEKEKRFDLVAQQISKINVEIINLKNSVFGCNDKIDLETTYYNKSRLEISSILEQDMAYDVSEFKSSLTEIQQKFNEWFGVKFSSQQFCSADNLAQPKLCQFISKKCNQQLQLTEKKLFKRIQTTDLLTERRIEQVTKTLNNVLQMLNEANNKKPESKDQFNIEPINQQSHVPQSLTRQSSLQNLKIKSFFNFGHK